LLFTIGRFYDPLSFLGPATTKAKIFAQVLRKDQLHWDSIPASLAIACLALCDAWPDFPYLKVEFHELSDASDHAYGASVYVVSKPSNQHACF